MITTGASVVIADDDPDHATIATLMLRRVSPNAIVTVITEPTCMLPGLLEAPRGALVLMDRMLQGMDATPRLATIHARRPDLRLVLLSSSLDAGAQVRAMAAGAEAAEEKPSTLAGWASLFGRLLDGTERLAAA